MTAFDPFTERPRSVCEACGSGLVFDAAAVPYLRNLAPAESTTYMGWYGSGWSLYACPRCGLVGAFSPLGGAR